MSYNELARENILQIMESIRDWDIENFAFINKRTYDLCHDRLEKLRAVRHNANTIATRFTPLHPVRGVYGLPSSYIHNPIGYLLTPRVDSDEDDDIDIISARSEARAEAREPNDDSDLEEQEDEYLELTGDLHWLRPLSKSALCHDWPRGNTASEKELEELVFQATRVGVEIPQAFLTFMGSPKLLKRMWLGGSRLALGSTLVKCNPEDDNNGGGYVIRFIYDYKNGMYWSLYVAPGGYHCVLQHDYDVNCHLCLDIHIYRQTGGLYDTHPTPTFYKGVLVACERLRITMAYPNFELFLAMKYFDGIQRAVEYVEMLFS